MVSFFPLAEDEDVALTETMLIVKKEISTEISIVYHCHPSHKPCHFMWPLEIFLEETSTFFTSINFTSAAKCVASEFESTVAENARYHHE